MSVKIDKTLEVAIRGAVDRLGSQAELARRSGVSQASIAKYLSGNIAVMSNQTFQQIAPFLNVDDKEIKEKSLRNKSPLIPSLTAIFEQLWKNNQFKVLSYSEELLESQSRVTLVEPFTDEELEKLASKGINCKYHYEFTISTRGFWWLYNVLVCSRKVGEELNNQLFKILLNAELPKDACRELRIKMFQIDVYEGREYDVLAVYLNGSPPKYFTPYTDVNRISQVFSLERNSMAPFELSNDSILELEFSDAEFEALKNGKTLKIFGEE